MSDPHRWRRRAVSIPLYFALAAVAWGLAPVWLALAAVFDLVTDRRGPRVRVVLFFLAYLGAEVAGVLAAIWVGLADADPVPRSAALQRWWTRVLWGALTRIYGMEVEVEGAPGPPPFLLFVRHTSTADTVLAAALVANPQRILLRYVLKRELLWDPCLDLVGQRLPNHFVDRSGRDRDAERAAVAALADGLGPREGVLIYPEGTRFTPEKLAKAKAALADDPVLGPLAARFRAVLPPRTGGPVALLGRGLDVVLLEHVGFEGAASMAELWRGAFVGATVRVRLRRVPAAEIPREGRDAWLFARWLETDEWEASR